VQPQFSLAGEDPSQSQTDPFGLSAIPALPGQLPFPTGVDHPPGARATAIRAAHQYAAYP